MRFNLVKTVAASVIFVMIASCGTYQEKTPSEENIENQQTTTAPTTTATQPVAVITAQEEAGLETEFAALPQGIMIKVPVDAEGNELSDQAEIKSYNGSAFSDDGADQAWNTSSVSTELDEDTSTQSFRGENNRNNNREQRQMNNRGNNNRGNGQMGNNRGNGQMGNNRGNGQMGNNRGNSGRHGNVSNGNRRPGRWGQSRHGGFYRGHRQGRRLGYRLGYFMNHYRPVWYSRSYYRGYWGYNNRPRCVVRRGFKYYYYSRPTCSGYNFCGRRY